MRRDVQTISLARPTIFAEHRKRSLSVERQTAGDGVMRAGSQIPAYKAGRTDETSAFLRSAWRLPHPALYARIPRFRQQSLGFRGECDRMLSMERKPSSAREQELLLRYYSAQMARAVNEMHRLVFKMMLPDIPK